VETASAANHFLQGRMVFSLRFDFFSPAAGWWLES